MDAYMHLLELMRLPDGRISSFGSPKAVKHNVYVLYYLTKNVAEAKLWTPQMENGPNPAKFSNSSNPFYR